MNKRILKRDSRWIWISLAIVTVLLRIGAGYFPWIIESCYSRGIFLIIRQVLDNSIGILPFSFLYVLILLLLFAVGRFIYNILKSPETPVQKFKRGLLSTLSFLSMIIFFFIWLWGFNYGRIPLEQHLQIAPKPLTIVELKTELDLTTAKIIDKRRMISGADSSSFGWEFIRKDIKEATRKEVEYTLSSLGYSKTGHPRLRFLKPNGFLLGFGAAGFYLPWTGECNVDPGLHPLKIPFVAAHEYYHAYGITDEGSCNFLAYLSCTSSSDPFTQYSGHLTYWRYLRSSYRYSDPEGYKIFKKNLPKAILTDLDSMYQHSLKYPEFFPSIREQTYDAYLKSQGVKEGIGSYSRIVMLIKAWRDKGQE